MTSLRPTCRHDRVGASSSHLLLFPRWTSPGRHSSRVRPPRRSAPARGYRIRGGGPQLSRATAPLLGPARPRVPRSVGLGTGGRRDGTCVVGQVGRGEDEPRAVAMVVAEAEAEAALVGGGWVSSSDTAAYCGAAARDEVSEDGDEE
jgi:hypothetical protein